MVGFQECVTGTITLVKVDALRRLFPLLLWYSCVYNAYPNFYNADIVDNVKTSKILSRQN